MRNYELNLLLAPTLGEEELKETVNSLLSLLQDQGAIVMSQDVKGRRSFFAAQKGTREALLATVRFTLDPSRLEAVEKAIKQDQKVLRHLLLSWAPRKTKERVVAPAAAEQPAQPEEKKAEIGDIDKRLEEIFLEEA